MYIDIVEKTLGYKGIERHCGVLPILKKEQVVKYMDLLDNDGRIKFSKGNYDSLCEIIASLSSGTESEFGIILYGDLCCSKIIADYPESEFCGYDITGDSCYLSPIYRAMFENTSEEHQYIRKFLNDNFLCNSPEDCDKIICYVNQCDDDFFEDDGILHPVQVYLMKK